MWKSTFLVGNIHLDPHLDPHLDFKNGYGRLWGGSTSHGTIITGRAHYEANKYLFFFGRGMIVKLMGRCRRLKEAFKLVDDLCQEYGLKVNIQVI